MGGESELLQLVERPHLRISRALADLLEDHHPLLLHLGGPKGGGGQGVSENVEGQGEVLGGDEDAVLGIVFVGEGAHLPADPPHLEFGSAIGAASRGAEHHVLDKVGGAALVPGLVHASRQHVGG